MPFDIESHIKRILEEKTSQKPDINLMEHLRLLGFHEIINDSDLGIYHVQNYTQKIAKKFKTFTKLMSGGFLKANESLVKKLKLFSVHLPIDDDFHLLFFLKAENAYAYKVLYDSCPECKELAPYEFPTIELRKSVNLEGFSGDCIFYDNTVSVSHQDEALLKLQYSAFDDFIQNTRMS